MSAPEAVTAIATRPSSGMSLASAALTIQEIVSQKQLIAQAMKELMKDGEHYGVIPGMAKRKDATGRELPPKPSLWKPGADLICSLFQLEADYIAEEVIHDPTYIYYRFKCVLTHIPSGRRVGSGIGSCNSREESFTRAAPKKCPKCSKETIFITKMENEPKYYCWAKKGGCGGKFKDGDPAIEQQDSGVPDPSDLDNAILKRATKRARMDAVLTATGASDFFTQDAEDLSDKTKRLFHIDVEVTPPAKEGSAPKAQGADTAENIRTTAATVPATSATPNGSTPTAQTGTAPKRPRAPSIKHDGTMASHKQVAYLHMLKHRAGVPECKPDECGIEVTDEKKWGKPRTRIQRCTYHAQLAAFKDCDGKPITTSVDLSENQISNLIDRYEDKLKRGEARAEEQPDLAAAFDQAEENARIRGELGPGADG